MADVSNKGTGELVREVAGDLQMLVRKELELARIELVGGLKSQLTGAGVIALAVLASLPGLLFLVVALALWLPVGPAAGFAIVGGALLLFTAGGILVGVWIMKRRRPKVGPAVERVKEDVRWARGHLTR